MKLYEAPVGSKVRIVGPTQGAPFTHRIVVDEVLEFHHVDGMYSLCKTASGDWCHPLAVTEVEIVPIDKIE